MAHTCPECGYICHCKGDIDDIDFGERGDCEHYLKCQDNDDEYESDDWDYGGE